MKETKELQRILNHVQARSGKDITTKRKFAGLVELRVVYLALALKTTRAGLKHIGEQVNRDHSLMCYYKLHKIDNVLMDDYYNDIYLSYIEINEKDLSEKDARYRKLESRFNVLEKLYAEVSLTAHALKEETILEPHELDYRKLNEQQKEIFKTRVEPILRMI